MKPVHTFIAVPSLPVPLQRLQVIAHNLRWAWNHDAIELFRRLDSDLWETSGHNPIRMLGAIDQDKLRHAAADESFLGHLDRIGRELDEYMTGASSWCRRVHGKKDIPTVAYFSAEFGLTECLSIFAGGLGILAGDHLKSASDLGIPLVGVGLLYQQGYFRQYLNEGGWQQEAYEDNDFYSLPLTQVLRDDGSPLAVEISYPERRVTARIWKAQVGRVPLYLLDTNLLGNGHPEDRDITDQLYGGDGETRLRQEILLGIGGFRALEALGVKPTVFHMNEGHSAFLALERVRQLMQAEGLTFAQARELASASLIFTGHTPVEAGHDFFSPDLMDRYFSSYARSLGLSRAEFLALGRKNADDDREPFCMTVLALRLASASNGVSKLHGQVSRRMWQSLWPRIPVDEVPVGHVTNGVHFRSWISYEMNQLYDRYLGPSWREEPAEHSVWQRAETIPAEELWRTHERRRERLVAFTRGRLRTQLRRRGASLAEIEAADEVLDPDVLTIGFARRFATYKRATLLLRDVERLGRILNNSACPVQIIFSGKAHPKDDAGKDLIRQIISLARRKDFRRRLVFLEEYDMAVSRYLVQGADVWLNNPLRPLEASGTSGMKAAANGALNISTLDGWWDEAWRESGSNLIGWAIGRGETYEDRGYQDEVEANALYDLLEQDVIPTFYDRGPGRLPRRWIQRMKASIGGLCCQYNTHRMVREYAERFYLMAHARFLHLAAGNASRARTLAEWMERVRLAWPEVRIDSIDDGPRTSIPVGERVRARARVSLGSLSPADVAVELYMGRVDADGEIADATARQMEPAGTDEQGRHIFEVEAVVCCRSGLQGYTARILPYHPDLPTSFFAGLITWAS